MITLITKLKLMIFTNRIFTIQDIETLNDLAIILKIINCSQLSAYKLDKVYFFNDSADASSLQEFAVLIVENGQWVQVDTLSVSLMTLQQLKDAILSIILGNYSFKVIIDVKNDSR